MKNFNRRAFIGKSGKGLTASMALSGLSFPAFIKNIGLLSISPSDSKPGWSGRCLERFSGHFKNHGE